MMIDYTTTAGMERIIELAETRTIPQIIREFGLDTTAGALGTRIRRFKRTGRPTYKRFRSVDRDVLLELAGRGVTQSEAARLVGMSPLLVSRRARKFGIEFARRRAKPERGATVEPPTASGMPADIQVILRSAWVSPEVSGISASRHLV